MIHAGKWLLSSYSRDGDWCFTEKPIDDEQEARSEFVDACRHARIYGGHYTLRSPEGAVERFSASAENE